MIFNNKYDQVFGEIPIFGMIHLAGENPVKRALDELAIFDEEFVDAAIIENYHGSVLDVVETLDAISKQKETKLVSVHIGINILPNEFAYALELANKYPFVGFIQLDHVAGTYTSGKLDIQSYNDARAKSPMTNVFGGVWPKYYQPSDGSDFETDLKVGVQRADAIVITGAATGKETPYDKIKKARDVIGEHPLIIGAGLTPDNAYKQLCISNGAIVGSSLKLNNDTSDLLDRYRIRDFMSAVKEARDYQKVFPLNDN